MDVQDGKTKGFRNLAVTCGALTVCQYSVDALYILYTVFTKTLNVGRDENTGAQKRELYAQVHTAHFSAVLGRLPKKDHLRGGRGSR